MGCLTFWLVKPRSQHIADRLASAATSCSCSLSKPYSSLSSYVLLQKLFKAHSACVLQLHFTDDAGEEPVELYHKLKLYGEDDPSGQASTKKPVSA